MTLIQASLRSRRVPLVYYGGVLLFILLAWLLTWLFEAQLRGSIFLFFFATIIFSAWFGGLGPGLFATGFTVLILNYFFLAPIYSLKMDDGEILRLTVFIATAVLTSWAAETRRRAVTLAHFQRVQWERTVTSIGDAVITTDDQGRVIFMNPIAERLTGWGREAVQNQPIGMVFRIFNEFTRLPAINPVDQVFQSGAIVGLANHTILISRDGTEHPIDDSAAPIRDEQGELTGVVLVFRDITERRQAEIALQMSEERYRSLVTATTSVVWVTDGSGSFATPQPSWEAYTGQSWAEHQGWGWGTALHPDDREMIKSAWAAAVAQQTDYEMRGRVWHAASATYRHFVVRGIPVRNPDGSVREWVGMLVDTEEHVQIQAERARLLVQEQAARQEAETSRQRWAFLAEVSAVLSASLDYEIILTRLAQLLVPELADWCAIDLLEASQTSSQVAAVYGNADLAERVRAYVRDYPLDLNSTTNPIAQVFRTGQSLSVAAFSAEAVATVTQDDQQQQRLAELRISSFICVPLLVQGRVAGVISLVYADSGRHYSAADLAFVEDVARRAALAVENARLYREIRQSEEQARRQAARMKALADASHTFAAASLNQQVILERLSRLGAEVVGDFCIVQQISADGTHLNAAVLSHADPSRQALLETMKDVPYPVGAGFMGRVAQTGQAAFIPEITPDQVRAGANPELWPTLEQLGIFSILIVPLRFRERLLGVVGCARSRPGFPYTADDQVFLQDLADRAALTLDNARLYTAEQQARQSAERTAKRIGRLQAVTAALSAALTPAQVAEIIVDQSIAALGAYAGGLVLLSESGDELEIVSSRGYSPDVLRHFNHFPLTAPTPLGEAVRNHELVLIESRADWAARYPQFSQEQLNQQTNANAAVPLLRSDGQAVGGLGLSFPTPRTFDADDRAFLHTLGQQCAQALERAWTVAALQRSEERFRVVQELSLDAFTIMRSVRDDTGTIVDFTWEYVNPAAAKALRHSSDELVGQQLLALLPQNREIGLFERYVHVVETNEPHDIEIYYEGEGITGWFRNMTVKLGDGIAISFRDVTNRRRIEEALRFLAEASSQLASSLDYDSILQHIARLAVPYIADICVVDLLEQGDTLRRVAAAHVDAAQEPRLYESFQHQPPARLDNNPVWQILQTGQTLHLRDQPGAFIETYAQDADHLSLIRAAGPHHTTLLVPLLARERTLGVMAFGLAGERRRFDAQDVALAEEIARRAALAIDNARLYREAQAAIQIRNQFLSIAAHELKNPLTALVGQAQLLQRRLVRAGNLVERDLRGIQVIVNQSQRLNSMIGMMLDISRIETGQLQITRSPLDLCTLARQVVEEVQPTLEGHTVVCEAPDETLMIEGDNNRLYQVLQNLLSNAIKYSPDGGTITVRVTRDAAQGCVAVIDQGIGIPADVLMDVFQRFYRANNAEARQIKGMGIGLYVVKEIVSLHGGTILVESQEGVGSSFTVVLPLASAPPPG